MIYQKKKLNKLVEMLTLTLYKRYLFKLKQNILLYQEIILLVISLSAFIKIFLS